jgi:serine/threonine-protein kinase RsbW
MQPDEAATRNAPSRSPTKSAGARSEFDEFSPATQRQARDLEVRGAAVSMLRTRAAPRAAVDQGGGQCAGRPRASDGPATGVPLEVSLPLDSRAPGAARIVLEGLRGRVATAVVEDAQLVVSELVTNSVRHSGAPDGEVVIIRVQLTSTMVRLEIENPGHTGVIAPRAPDLEAGGGFGLNLVQALSERWGCERFAVGGTRVWAQLSCAPSPADAPGFARRRRSSSTGSQTTGERLGRSARPRKEAND